MIFFYRREFDSRMELAHGYFSICEDWKNEFPMYHENNPATMVKFYKPKRVCELDSINANIQMRLYWLEENNIEYHLRLVEADFNILILLALTIPDDYCIMYKLAFQP